jgi:hypothetical protein
MGFMLPPAGTTVLFPLRGKFQMVAPCGDYRLTSLTGKIIMVAGAGLEPATFGL